MARSHRRKRASGRRHHNAGTRRRRRHNPARVHHRRRRNPGGFGGVTQLAALGGGAVLGSALPKVASQFVLGSSNTGWMGYGANLAGTFILAWLGDKFVRNPQFKLGIIAGGIGSVMSRIISDYSLLGPYGQSLGIGDYMVSNWVTPQRLVDGLNSPMVEIPSGWAPTTVVAAGNGMGYAPLYG